MADKANGGRSALDELFGEDAHGYKNAVMAAGLRQRVREEIEQLQAKLEAAERDAARWRWTSQRAWFVDAGAYAFDLRFGPGDFSTEPRNADADDVQQAIDEAMAEDDAAIDAQREEGK